MSLIVTGSRSVSRVINTVQMREGAGFLVRRPFPTQTLMDFDPFLLLDHLGPVNYGPGQAVGAPDHPHRGFETVSYILEGKWQHKDSQGNSGVLSGGDVQWMTAGAGVVHSEMPEDEFFRTGGRLHAFQLWVNLPRVDKMIRPRYQDIPAAGIPEAFTEDNLVKVRVIAGEALGVKAVVDTRTPIMFLHFTLQPGGKVCQLVPANYNAFAYVIDGQGQAGSEERAVKEGQMVAFAQDGEEVLLSVSDEAEAPLNLLLIAGVPLQEPVVRYGPFVMNTEKEIYQAIADYNAGRMGKIDI
ncbi:MAG: pirin domain protein [Chloroflexi bacterium]|jgi:redox-sensitive bicupin YhaK (pirin superfamily)|nr:pirin domain protein [Chloroflexota bacterium]